MSEIPAELKYTKSHEWVKDNGDGTVTIGITDHAQASLGDLVFVELPEVGASLGANEACAVVESVKAASDIYVPLAGEIIEVNTNLEDEPETINAAPYDAGWIFTMKIENPKDLDALMDAERYSEEAEE
ncbi:MAG TPA: glycine cleavage system protein GcvH [Gammaproteobacteria bacterium]|nr:glycine cleavage system protein GcvH [Gammaproteobacteria bacterium]